MDGMVREGIILSFDRRTDTGKVLVCLFLDPDVFITKTFQGSVCPEELRLERTPVYVTTANNVVVLIAARG